MITHLDDKVIDETATPLAQYRLDHARYARQSMTELSQSSSVDPISILAEYSSPVKSPRRNMTLQPKSPNVRSPKKSMIMLADSENGESPWKIKVTVEAERDESHTSPISARRAVGTTMNVPLKPADQQSPVKINRELQRPNSSPKRRRSRKSTPPRRRATPARKTRASLANGAVEVPEQLQHDPHSNDTNMSTKNRLLPPSAATINERRKDEEMWRAMATHSDEPERREGEDQDSASGSESEEYEVDNIDNAPMPGEMTVLESEEFSMISVDSLSSQNHNSTPAQATEQSTKRATTGSRLPSMYVDRSYLPSSPPVLSSSRETPPIDATSPSLPQPPIASIISLPKIISPIRDNVVRSGRVLQDIVGSSASARSHEDTERRRASYLNGFSSGTRRQLRESLQIGQNLASHSASPSIRVHRQSGSASVEISDERSRRKSSEMPLHRLPTPEEPDEAIAAKSSSTDMNAELTYPELGQSQIADANDNGQYGYDAMSWIATGKPIAVHANDVVYPSSSSSSNRVDQSPAKTSLLQQAKRNDNQSLAPAPQETIGSEQDIWQEEASRSIEDVGQPQQSTNVDDLFEGPLKPRRSKLPRTWRRESAHDFHYSDSPEPEDVAARKPSEPDTSRKTSSVVTPPTTDDEADNHIKPTPRQQQATRLNVSQASKAQPINKTNDSRIRQRQDLLSPMSSSSGESTSPDGEDTGLFWQSNLPNLYGRRQRPSLRRNSQESSVLSDLKHPLDSSPMKNTIMTESPSGIEKKKASPLQTRSTVNKSSSPSLANSFIGATPTRPSFVKSSNVKGSPLKAAKSSKANEVDQSRQQDEHEETDMDNSRSEISQDLTSSDIRQLRPEMINSQKNDDRKADSRETDATAEKEYEDDSIDVTESEVVRSYQEQLNLGSPTKIAVKFNDSSLEEGPLSPKKKYPPLFDLAPTVNVEKPKVESQPINNEKTFPAPKQEEPSAGLLTRLSSTFWSAVTTPNNATTAVSAKQNLAPTTNPPSKVIAATTLTSTIPAAVSDSTLRLRRKYGLLRNQHPFTYAHIRTLHRMLNSIRTHPDTTIIPLDGPLTYPSLQTLLGTTSTCNTGKRVQTFTFTLPCLHVVEAFMSLLLPETEIKRLQRHTGGIEWGDVKACAEARGFDSRGRHGDWRVWGKEEPEKGLIEAKWLAEIVRGIVWREELIGEKSVGKHSKRQVVGATAKLAQSKDGEDDEQRRPMVSSRNAKCHDKEDDDEDKHVRRWKVQSETESFLT